MAHRRLRFLFLRHKTATRASSCRRAAASCAFGGLSCVPLSQWCSRSCCLRRPWRLPLRPSAVPRINSPENPAALDQRLPYARQRREGAGSRAGHEPARRFPRSGDGRHLHRLHGRRAADQSAEGREAGGTHVPDAARGPDRHRPRHRLFRAARLERPDAEVRRAHAGAQGADRPLRIRQDADAARSSSWTSGPAPSTCCGACISPPAPTSRSCAWCRSWPGPRMATMSSG